MKTTKAHCFSNGTEWMWWLERNCYRCWKASHLKSDNATITKYRCKIEAEMDAQAAGVDEIGQRTYDVAHMADCPYRQTEKPQYAHKKRNRKQTQSEQLF